MRSAAYVPQHVAHRRADRQGRTNGHECHDGDCRPTRKPMRQCTRQRRVCMKAHLTQTVKNQIDLHGAEVKVQVLS